MIHHHQHPASGALVHRMEEKVDQPPSTTPRTVMMAECTCHCILKGLAFMLNALFCQGLLQKDHELLVTQLSSLHALKEQALICCCSAPCLVQTCIELLALQPCSMQMPTFASTSEDLSHSPTGGHTSLRLKFSNSTRAGTLTNKAA